MTDELWSYSTGIRGLNRVRAYERIPGGPIQVEYTGGRRQTLANLAGVPVVDRVLAEKVADALAAKLKAKGSGKVAREVLGIEESRTLEELLDRYHRDRGPEWSEVHRKKQGATREWWAARLGLRTKLTEITEADVERAVSEWGRQHDWAPRTRQRHLVYLKAVFRYAHRKLHWIPAENSMSGVSVPRPDRGGPAYSTAEVRRLLEAAPSVDPRVAAALNIAYDTQARSRAVLHLRISDYLGDGEVRFGKATDKAKKSRISALSPSAQAAVERILGPREWLLEQDGRRMTYDELLALLRKVEESAGVAHVPGRGWHAIKRRGVTDARRAVGDMGAVARQSGTLASTLERVYEQDDMEPKRQIAEAMERLRRGEP
jgi:integrase